MTFENSRDEFSGKINNSFDSRQIKSKLFQIKFLSIIAKTLVKTKNLLYLCGVD